MIDAINALISVRMSIGAPCDRLILGRRAYNQLLKECDYIERISPALELKIEVVDSEFTIEIV